MSIVIWLMFLLYFNVYRLTHQVNFVVENGNSHSVITYRKMTSQENIYMHTSAISHTDLDLLNISALLNVPSGKTWYHIFGSISLVVW